MAEAVGRFAALFERYVLRYPCHYGIVLERMRMDAQAGVATPFFDPTDDRLPAGLSAGEESHT